MLVLTFYQVQSNFPPPLLFSFHKGSGPHGVNFIQQLHVNETSLTCVFVIMPENLHRRGAERQADTKGPEGCAKTSQAGGTKEAAQGSGIRPLSPPQGGNLWFRV